MPKHHGIQLDEEEFNRDKADGHLTISINDITALCKRNNLGLVGRMATSALLAVKGAAGTGLDITFVRRGVPEATFIGVGDGPRDLLKAVEGREETVSFEGVVRRNELFDRLVAIGEQRWEML